ncbi:MAG: hypothetical protein Q9159_003538 [Coniocarpon cinnabarinum]
MVTKPVALILGAGPRVGTAVAEKFVSNGYNVAVASRKGSQVTKGALALQADFANPETIPGIFHTAIREFGISPSVVIYNAGTLTPPPDPESVLSIPPKSVASDLIVNTVSAYAAAQQAVLSWETLPAETKKTFIFTGNIQNISILPIPLMLDAGMGKSASAYWIGAADTLYASKGYRFFYADERHVDGKNKGMSLDGAAHGSFYAQLANHETVPWHATFVKDKGYVKF